MAVDIARALVAHKDACGWLIGMLRASTMLWTLFAIAVGMAGWRVVYALYFSPLRHIPGPLLSRVTGKRLEVEALLGRFAKYGKKYSEKYGDINVCQPNSVCIADPADIRRVLSSPLMLKDSYYTLLRFTGIDNTISTTRPDEASKARRMLGPHFSTSYLNRMEPLIMEFGARAIVRRWDALVARSADGAATVNYAHAFGLCTFNVVSRLVYGQDIAALDPDSSGAELQWVQKSTMFVSMRTILQLLPRPLFRLLTLPWDHMFQRFYNHVGESIAARRQLLDALGPEDERPADLLQALLDCEDPGSRVHLNSEQIHAESLLLLIGGIDPTAFTLIWTTHLLLLYPACYQRAVDEVRSRFPPQGDAVITHAAARGALPYLEACILESMRLIPVPSVMIPRVVCGPGITIKGHHLPPGTRIFADMYGSHMSQRHWTDPHRFDPERFLAPGSRLSHCVFTFGYGTRICMGKQLAWMNMLTIMASLLRRYDFALPKGHTRTGPTVIDPATGYPKIMAMTHLLSRKPACPDADCLVTITRAGAT
ncbi:hypothetical protein IWQ57_003730 [Coemansia nantahalensis]|uniref:Uncharacterized protein n=1 Tax=Coemansia nantahalensis TaxID=2789366 RepID=A0ACC1JV60_9FUNG|nr:hypothetical protein IWQ57_003730 [Coemansia nantahalensis]